MVLLSCSGGGGGIYANLANAAAGHNCSRAIPTYNSSLRGSAIGARDMQVGIRLAPPITDSGRPVRGLGSAIGSSEFSAPIRQIPLMISRLDHEGRLVCKFTVRSNKI